MRIARLFSLFAVTLGLTSSALAAVSFEGQYRLSSGSEVQGYFLMKKEVLPGGRNKVMTYSAGKDGRIDMAVKEADIKYTPVSVMHTARIGATTVTTTGSLRGSQYNVTRQTTGAGAPKTESMSLTVPADVQFELFIPDYVKMVKGKLEPGTRMVITRLLDEIGISVVDVVLGQRTKVNGNDVVPVELRPKDAAPKIVLYVTDQMEIVRIELGPARADLMPTMKDAVGSLSPNMAEIEKIMGGAPKPQRKAVVTATPSK